MRDRTWDRSASHASAAQALPPAITTWIFKISKQVLIKVQVDTKICTHHEIS